MKNIIRLMSIGVVLIASMSTSCISTTVGSIMVSNKSSAPTFFYTKAIGCVLVCEDPYGANAPTCCGSLLVGSGQTGEIPISAYGFAQNTLYLHASQKDSKGNEIIYNYNKNGGMATVNSSGGAIVFPDEFSKDS